MSESRIAILMAISRAIKGRRPFSLTSYMPGPLEDSQDRVHDATIRQVLKRRDEGLPQTFSGVSSDFVFDEVDDTA